ncbi:CapA family protein [Arsenicicoccus sp. UBA7492]|uniref:CapA family protein n=1 Tax=Arsenicicoccus sp. UBA7492 TaxID=1946057 RepID=UPI00257CBE7E|nr:CapA family protein [Arsenicicoccus sp. UBA7492]
MPSPDPLLSRARRSTTVGLLAVVATAVTAGGLSVVDAFGPPDPTPATLAREAASPAARSSAIPTSAAGGAGSTVAPPRTASPTTGSRRQGVPGAQPITLAFGGDTQAHGSAGRIVDEGLGATGKLLARADLAMVNLETVVAADRTGLRPQPKPFTFVTGPSILGALHKEGVDVVTAANNHTMDFGDRGMTQMLAAKASSPVPMVGLGKDDTEAWAPWSTQVQGRRVVVFGATDVLDAHLDWKAGPGKPGLAKVRDEEGFDKLLDGVRRARAAGPTDVIVVYLHSGIEKQRCPTPRQVLTDSALAEAGATVVVGAHAHVLQTTTTVGDTAVAYGIGNFVFGSGSSAETRASGVLTVTVPGDAGAPTMTFDPARVTQGLPVLLEGAERERALQTWRARGEGCS